jgi:hypothetical protein
VNDKSCEIERAPQVLMSRRPGGHPNVPVMQDIIAPINSLGELVEDLRLYVRARNRRCLLICTCIHSSPTRSRSYGGIPPGRASAFRWREDAVIDVDTEPHGGQLTLSSPDQSGTVATLTLPIRASTRT